MLNFGLFGNGKEGIYVKNIATFVNNLEENLWLKD